MSLCLYFSVSLCLRVSVSLAWLSSSLSSGVSILCRSLLGSVRPCISPAKAVRVSLLPSEVV